MTLDEIKTLIPHREPMLLIDEVIQRQDGSIVCRRTFRDNEFFLQGHFPEYPLVPGVMLCEAAMQAGAVLAAGMCEEAGIPVATRLTDARFRRMVRPGDTVEIHVEISERSANVFFMRAKLMLGEAVAARCEFACMITKPADAQTP